MQYLQIGVVHIDTMSSQDPLSQNTPLFQIFDWADPRRLPGKARPARQRHKAAGQYATTMADKLIFIGRLSQMESHGKIMLIRKPGYFLIKLTRNGVRSMGRYPYFD
jgi:hypothetical protein